MTVLQAFGLLASAFGFAALLVGMTLDLGFRVKEGRAIGFVGMIFIPFGILLATTLS